MVFLVAQQHHYTNISICRELSLSVFILNLPSFMGSWQNKYAELMAGPKGPTLPEGVGLELVE